MLCLAAHGFDLRAVHPASQHSFSHDISRWTDRSYNLTGKYPVLFGQDFGFSGGDDKDSTESRPAMIAELKRQYENGAVIMLTWHADRPTDMMSQLLLASVQGHLSDYEWHELLTPRTYLNKRWYAQVDVIAGYLQQLRDVHVPNCFARTTRSMGTSSGEAAGQGRMDR